MVNCESARDVAEALFLSRNLKPEEVQIKCGLDFGQGSLKVHAMVPLGYVPQHLYTCIYTE